MESDASESNLVLITTRKGRLRQFCCVYWRMIVFAVTPIIMLPIAFIGDSNAYKCFYIFITTMTFWITDVVHPCVSSLVPIALATIIGAVDTNIINKIYLRNDILDCIGIMMFVAAIEHSLLHRRIALKFLMTFGCSHYRLSFILFFITMFLTMWVSNIIACGLMLPFVKCILIELERMGLLEVYQTIGKNKQISSRHEQNVPEPTDYTVFYFLGIAYSATIGSLATFMGSQSDQMFKVCSETFFPEGPKVEYPQLLLLNLPGVLLMELLVYLWLNFYFLGMFKIQSEVALQTCLSEEESQYISTLLKSQYYKLGAIKFHDGIVAVLIILTMLLLAIMNSSYLDEKRNIKISSPCLITIIVLFVMPVNLNFAKYLKKSSELNEPLPTVTSKSCLNWSIVENHLHWSVLLILVSSCTIFESLKDSGMTNEFLKFLMFFKNWPTSIQALIVIIFCKLLSECASDVCVVFCLLPQIADLSVKCRVHPHYLMMASTLSSSLSFHLPAGSPVNAMVAAYAHIPTWKMMCAGVGPSILGCMVTWFTVALWSKVVWTDLNVYPVWAENYVLDK